MTWDLSWSGTTVLGGSSAPLLCEPSLMSVPLDVSSIVDFTGPLTQLAADVHHAL